MTHSHTDKVENNSQALPDGKYYFDSRLFEVCRKLAQGYSDVNTLFEQLS